MIQADPTKRPTMQEVVTRFAEMCQTLLSYQLRLQVLKGKEPPSLFNAVSHAWTTIGNRIAGRPAIPRPPTHR